MKIKIGNKYTFRVECNSGWGGWNYIDGTVKKTDAVSTKIRPVGSRRVVEILNSRMMVVEKLN